MHFVPVKHLKRRKDPKWIGLQRVSSADRGNNVKVDFPGPLTTLQSWMGNFSGRRKNIGLAKLPKLSAALTTRETSRLVRVRKARKTREKLEQ